MSIKDKVLKKLFSKEFLENEVEMWEEDTEVYEVAIDLTLKLIVKLIKDVEVALMFTHVKDQHGNKIEVSDGLVDIVKIWWEGKSKELLKEIKGDEN